MVAAVEVVAGGGGAGAVGRAEHHRRPGEVSSLPLRQPGQLQQVTRHGVPDGEAAGRGVLDEAHASEQDTAMTDVDHELEAAEVAGARAEGGGRREQERSPICRRVIGLVEDSQHRGSPVVMLAEPAAEATVGEDAAPPSAD